jgi:membrane protein YqaA with SNARE-associated domain
METWAAGIPDQLPALAELFALIYALNVIPAFAPPTWVALAFIGLTIPEIDVWLLVLVATCAATLGRLSLARLSRRIVRRHFLSAPALRNIDAIRQGLEKRGTLTFGLFLMYAFSPLPSNYLFIAYGMTTLRLASVAAPFFVGRFCSYGATLTTASLIAEGLHIDLALGSLFGFYFVLSQSLLIPVIYCFTKIDWHGVFEKRNVRWLKTTEPSPHTEFM